MDEKDHDKHSAPAAPEHETDRLAEPVDAEQPPRLPFPVVAIGASAGGIEAFGEFFKAMPADAGLAFVLILHLPPDHESLLAEILSKHTAMPVRQVQEGLQIEANHVYVIRPGNTMTVRDGVLHLSESVSKPGHSRPVDDFFRSLAEEQRERAIGVIMSGMGSNGTLGAQQIKAVGGMCIAQDPQTAKFPDMPRNMIDGGSADFVLRPDEMPDALMRYAQHPYAKGRSAADQILRREKQHFNQVLAILRTRTRHEFSGYKKPTLLRRVQRRMGLNQVTELADYARLLRQSPNEVTSLSDDMMIHVTGFFRDPQAWEALRKSVIVPLVAARKNGDDIRVWVTACSSGEEAYTLAMLLTEEMEKATKNLDIKIFATDTAERSLGQARAGVYPGGIESEVSPARLSRFFERDDAVYRVRADLRELVVFAPQNVLQDPPFSRLDICTCRNLLIYLEPEMQQRVLHLLHFGLRDDGTLFLGNSETISGAEELFHPVDKKAHIYRRIGPTRHGLVEFPMARVEGRVDNDRVDRRAGPRTSLTQLTQRALLERHTPVAVVVDRQHNIVYFHGNTTDVLLHPPGEPTRDLFSLAREQLRPALRAALQQASAQAGPVTISDGVVDTRASARRFKVTAERLDHRPDADYYLITFEPEPALPIARAPGETESQDVGELQSDLHRVRDQLQHSIEELQSSNEEMRASNEEVTSMNEELQSTNEELETSKEELQSLNEELTTVNSQLHTKMEELEGMTSDLTSLLASIDIGVIFLDRQFHIRRYTPSATDLLELISSDVGRPITDLAKKFSDPELLNDSQAVLDKLIPAEREIVSNSGRAYLRRVLPYRTSDNRIDGVVVTFLDITRRKEAEEQLRQNEENYRLILQGVQDYAIFMLDLNGLITTWNAGAEQILGFSERDAVGNPGQMIFTPEDRASREPEKELKHAREHGRAVDERWYLRKDGSRFWGSGAMAALRDEKGSLRGFVKVLRDNTDRKRAEEALQVANQKSHAARLEAENASEAKDLFLATVSHELRTPLSAILLWAKILKSDEVKNPDKLQQAREAIQSSAEVQRKLIEDLLDSASITAGKLRLELKQTPLRGLMKASLDAIRPTAELKGVALSANLAAGDGNILADPNRMQQVMWNLLTNALKFTPAGGKINVSLRRVDGRVEIKVTDTGQGIDASLLPRVFERFVQAEGAFTRSHGGLGLGLSITKQLVELHGGSISAQSAGPGKGASFIVQLPLSKTKTPARRAIKKSKPVKSVKPSTTKKKSKRATKARRKS